MSYTDEQNQAAVSGTWCIDTAGLPIAKTCYQEVMAGEVVPSQPLENRHEIAGGEE